MPSKPPFPEASPRPEAQAAGDKPQGFPRKNRLVHKAEFLHLRSVSQKWVGRHWILFYAKNSAELPRLAVTISARYGNAVQRNRFRRFMREKFRLNQASLKNYDLHFIAKQKPAHVPEKRYKDELHEDFQRLLHRLA